MKPSVHIMEPKIGEIRGDDLSGVWIHIGDQVKLNFDSEENAIAFSEMMRDKLIEGGDDGNK